MKIGFIGLGKLGMECAEYMAEFCHVDGYDIRIVMSNKVNVVASIHETVIDKDFTFIAVPTPHEYKYDGSTINSHLSPKDFDYTYVTNVLEQLSNINHNSVIVLISTVLPGTIRKEFLHLLDVDKFIYNPYLIAMGSVKADMKNPEMIIIGNKTGVVNENTRRLISFYKSICNETRYEVGTWDEAEAIKIFYNTFISMKIGFVNMIQDVAEKSGNIDPDIVANAIASSKMRITSNMYMKPGMGDGGPCHPRDNIALRFLSEKLDLGYDLFGTIMEIREKQAENIARKLVSYENDIVILGESYKPSVDLTEGSYSLLIGNIVKQISNLNVYYDKEPDNKGEYTYLLAHRSPCKFDGHRFNAGSVIVDPWRETREIPGASKYRIVHYGWRNS